MDAVSHFTFTKFNSNIHQHRGHLLAYAIFFRLDAVKKQQIENETETNLKTSRWYE
jgi:hypothetical protein